MATSNRISNSFIDGIFPVFGTPRTNTPIWDEGRSMFIVNDYVSNSGNRYYTGVRVTDRFVIYIYIGKYHNWDYLDKVEVYVFDGKEMKIIGTKEPAKEFYSDMLVVRLVSEIMMSYARSQQVGSNIQFSTAKLEEQISQLISSSYRSMLDDSGYARLNDAIKLLPAGNRR